MSLKSINQSNVVILLDVTQPKNSNLCTVDIFYLSLGKAVSAGLGEMELLKKLLCGGDVFGKVIGLNTG